MNEILAKLEELSMEDLTYLFEYLVELINERKRQIQREKRLKRKLQCKQKNLKHKEISTKNSQVNCMFVQDAQ